MIMQKWKNVLNIVNGKNQKDVANSGGLYPIYGSGGIIGRAIDFLCPAGTTIVGRKGTINKPIFVNEPFWNVDTAFGLVPHETLNSKYLYYFCCGYNFSELDNSTTIPSLSKSVLLEIEIPLPPLPEQERIVARIEELFSELDKGVEALQTVKAQLRVFRQAVLKEAFEGIDAFTDLEMLSERIFDGPFGTNLRTSDYVPSGVRVIRLENIKYLKFDDANKSYVTIEKYESIKQHTVLPTDLIMSTFITDCIKVCQMPVLLSHAINKADCVGIRLKHTVCPKFIMYYLSSHESYVSLSSKIHGATRPRVNTKQIKRISVPRISLPQQESIVAEIESRLSVCDQIEKTVDESLAKAESLRQSILKKAFEGRLV